MNYAMEIRRLVVSCRVFVPGVRAIIVNSNEEILLQHRRDNALWCFPGGSVELDETALEALRQEIREETSLEVIEAEPMGLYCGPDQKFSYPNGDEVQCFAIAFIVRNWRRSPHADGQEGAAVRFYPGSELPEKIVPVHRQTLEDFLRYDGSFIFE